MRRIIDDLAAEHDDLDRLVGDLGPADWERPTPAEGWAIRDQISHLAFFDERAALAATDADAFMVETAEALQDPVGFADLPVRRGRALAPAELLEWWRRARRAMLDSFEPLDRSDRLPWYGPPMSALSFATARLMETWAHGQDVADALGVSRVPTDRLRHVCHIGVTTFGWSYRNRGRNVPDVVVKVELEAPDGGTWIWNEAGSEVVSGPAEDFCLVVTQRRNVADTSLVTEGATAAEWMRIAQCFAGPPTDGRPAA